MDVSLTLIVIMAVLFACGVYAMLERSLTRVLIGFLLLGNATNLLLLIVMGVPGEAPFHGADGRVSDPLPQALTLTAIVITFAVSAFLLALIYRSWQLGQADTVEDDEADIALRARTDADEDVMEDESDESDEDATTDFVGVQTSPITVLHMRDHPAIHDDAPMDRPMDRVERSKPGSPPRPSEPDAPSRSSSEPDAPSRSLSETDAPPRSLSERSETKRIDPARDAQSPASTDEEEDRS